MKSFLSCGFYDTASNPYSDITINIYFKILICLNIFIIVSGLKSISCKIF